MNLKQFFGILLCLAGVGALVYGLSIQDSVEYKFVSAYGGSAPGVAMLIIGGIVAAIVGVLLLVFGRDKESDEVRPVRPAGQPRQSEDALDVQQFDDGKLAQIAESDGLYRPEVVEASRRELELRRKCEELLPQVREKDDDQLREMTGNPALYTEELIRTARMVQEERRRLWLEEQERAEQAARLEREKQAEERRQQRIAARKRRRPYVLAVLALLVLAGAGAGYYAYRQKQERLAMERRAAEERRIAQEKKAAEERAAQERWAEEQRHAEEKRKREEEQARAERQRQAEAQARADRERREAGFYRVGELYEKNGLRGIVFRIDETGAHGYIISLQKEELTYIAAENKIYYANKAFRLPSKEEMGIINAYLTTLNKGLKSAGGDLFNTKDEYWLDYEEGYYSYFFKPGNDSMYRSLKISNTPDSYYARWVYEF